MPEIRLLEENERSKAKKLWEEAFPEDAGAFTDWYFRARFCPENCYGLFVEGELASMAQVGKEQLFLNGTILPGNLIRGVATAKIHGGKGYASQLISHILKELVANEQALSVLKTFIHPFYRRLGYEVYSRRSVRKEIPGGSNACRVYTDMSEISDKVLGELLACYCSYLQGKSGYVYRDLIYFRNLLEEALGQSQAMLLTLGKPVISYCIAYAEEDELYAEEVVYQKKEDLSLFAQAAAEQGKGFSYLCFEEGEPDAMARAVSVPRLLEATVSNGAARIEVTDDLIGQNAGIWQIEAQYGKVSVRKSLKAADICLSSGELAVLCMGGRLPKALPEQVSTLWEEAETGIFEQY